MAARAALAETDPDLAQVPSVEDLLVTRVYDTTITVAGGAVILPVFVAPFPLQIGSISATIFGGAVTADGSNYWSLRPRRYRVASNFATDYADTISTSGTNWTLQANKLQGESWNLDDRELDAAYRVLRRGDVFAIRLAPTGTPSSLTAPIVFTVRYEPL